MAPYISPYAATTLGQCGYLIYSIAELQKRKVLESGASQDKAPKDETPRNNPKRPLDLQNKTSVLAVQVAALKSEP